MNRAARAAALVCGAAVMAGCSGAGAAAPSTTARIPQTVTPSSTAPATTSAPPRSTAPREAATTARGPATDDAQLRALHDRFLRAMANIESLSASSIGGFATGIERQRLVEGATRLREQHLRTQGHIQSRVMTVQVVDATHARVRSCVRFTTELVGASGTVGSYDAVGPRVTQLVAEKTASGWRVEDWFTGGNIACAP
jgi:hypothetical protein